MDEIEFKDANERSSTALTVRESPNKNRLYLDIFNDVDGASITLAAPEVLRLIQTLQTWYSQDH